MMIDTSSGAFTSAETSNDNDEVCCRDLPRLSMTTIMIIDYHYIPVFYSLGRDITWSTFCALPK